MAQRPPLLAAFRVAISVTDVNSGPFEHKPLSLAGWLEFIGRPPGSTGPETARAVLTCSNPLQVPASGKLAAQFFTASENEQLALSCNRACHALLGIRLAGKRGAERR